MCLDELNSCCVNEGSDIQLNDQLNKVSAVLVMGNKMKRASAKTPNQKSFVTLNLYIETKIKKESDLEPNCK